MVHTNIGKHGNTKAKESLCSLPTSTDKHDRKYTIYGHNLLTINMFYHYTFAILPNHTHIIVAVARQLYVRLLVTHGNRETAHAWNHVLVVAEIDQHVHNSVPDLAEHGFAEANAD